MDDKWTPLEKKLLGVVALLGVALIGLLFALWPNSDAAEEIPLPAYSPEKEKPSKPERDQEIKELVVDIKGAVKHPGIYHLPREARIMDAITKAGGPGKDADLDQVNLAAPLTDGTAVYIPRKGEENIPTIGTEVGAARGSGDGKVNINTAGMDELQQLNGVGPAKAEAILRYREENGSFSSVEELTNVSGIGEKTLEKFKEQVTVQ